MNHTKDYVGGSFPSIMSAVDSLTFNGFKRLGGSPRVWKRVRDHKILVARIDLTNSGRPIVSVRRGD